MTRCIDDFLEQVCISEMSDKHKENWIWFASTFAETLDQGALIKKTAYTLHDFSHHCFNIYRCVSKYLIYQDSIKNRELSSEALYLFNVAVLFHDYSMTFAGFNRLKHSEESLCKFMEKCDELNSQIIDRLSHNQRRIVGAIILAHSDIKKLINNKEEIETNTLLCQDWTQFNSGDLDSNIPAKLLAGLLRLADELDVTMDRAGNQFDKIGELDHNDPEEQRSYSFWKKLEYISHLSRNADKVQLFVSEKKYNESTTQCTNEAKKILEKILLEFSIIQEECFSSYPRIISCKEIALCFPQRVGILNNEANLNKCCEIEEKSSSEIDHVKDYIDQIEGLSHESPVIKKSPVLINQEFMTKIDKWIEEDELVIGGHFRINNSYCSREWIVTNQILDNKDRRNLICMEFVKHINKRWLEGTNTGQLQIVGLEIYGSIVASSIAFDLNLPFSYIIPEKAREHYSMQDKKFKKLDNHKIILITDVIVSGETIAEAITANQIGDNVIAVYSILYRPVAYCEGENGSEFKLHGYESLSTYCLNDAFKIHIFKRENCSVKELSNRCGSEYRCIDCHSIKN